LLERQSLPYTTALGRLSVWFAPVGRLRQPIGNGSAGHYAALLTSSAKDAEDLARFFQSQEGKAYSKVEAHVPANPDRLTVLNELKWLVATEKGDVSLLFLAGHGITDKQGQFYFLTADSDLANPELDDTAVSRDKILKMIQNRRGPMVVMLDACHSGAGTDAGGISVSRVDMNRHPNELSDDGQGVIVYASSQGRELSYESPEWSNGAFTKALIDGLSGAADRDKTGWVEADELGTFVRRTVVSMTKQRQTPQNKTDAAPDRKLSRLK
jgi:uncharacterized caspase-like protein